MIIEVKGQNYEEVKKVLNDAGINCMIYENAYKAVCAEEIDNTLYSAEVELNDETFKELKLELSDELYNSNEAEEAFQVLTETSELITNRALHIKLSK